MIKRPNNQEILIHDNHNNIRKNIKLTNKNTDLRQFNFVSQQRGHKEKKPQIVFEDSFYDLHK